MMAIDLVTLVPVDQPESTWTSFPNQTFTPSVPAEAIMFGPRSDENLGPEGSYQQIDAAGSTSSTTAPTIITVTISGPNSVNPNGSSYDIPSGDGNQIEAVPIGGAEIIKISFSNAIDVGTFSNALTLTGVFTGNDYTSKVVFQIFDVSTNTATWEYTP